MNKNFETLYAARTTTLSEIIRIPNEKLKEITECDLINFLANFMLENLDKLPAIIEKREIQETGSVENILRINLISDDEYRRLIEIERQSEHFRFLGDKR